jgi:hypothetical protein
MGSTGQVKVAADCDCNCCSCCCGGMGFIRQRAEGSGTLFLNAGGTVVQKVRIDFSPASSLTHIRNSLRMKPLLWTPTPSSDSRNLFDLVSKELADVALVVLVGRACTTLPSQVPVSSSFKACPLRSIAWRWSLLSNLPNLSPRRCYK